MQITDELQNLLQEDLASITRLYVDNQYTAVGARRYRGTECSLMSPLAARFSLQAAVLRCVDQKRIKYVNYFLICALSESDEKMQGKGYEPTIPPFYPDLISPEKYNDLMLIISRSLSRNRCFVLIKIARKILRRGVMPDHLGETND